MPTRHLARLRYARIPVDTMRSRRTLFLAGRVSRPARRRRPLPGPAARAAPLAGHHDGATGPVPDTNSGCRASPLEAGGTIGRPPQTLPNPRWRQAARRRTLQGPLSSSRVEAWLAAMRVVTSKLKAPRR
jgi:hypothetical protein